MRDMAVTILKNVVSHRAGVGDEEIVGAVIVASVGLW